MPISSAAPACELPAPLAHGAAGGSPPAAARSPSDLTDRRHQAYLRLDAAFRHDHEAGALDPAARERLRGLAGRLLAARDDGHDLVQQAAALLSALVAERALSDEAADLLRLDIAACAAARRFTSRPAAQASIP